MFQNNRESSTLIRGKSPTIWLLALSCTFLLIEVSHGLPNQDITWTPDTNPLSPLISLKKVFLDGWNTGHSSPYPDFHRWLLCVLLVPYMCFHWVSGNLEHMNFDNGYPYGIESFDTMFFHIAVITRIVTVMMTIGSAIFIAKTTKLLFCQRDETSSQLPFFSIPIFAFSPGIIYYAHGETLDIPMLFWVSLGMYSYAAIATNYEAKYYYWLAISAAFSTATKDYAYSLYLLLPIPLLMLLTYHQNARLSVKGIAAHCFDKKHLMAIFIFLIAFIFSENLLWNPSGFINHVTTANGADPTEVTVDFGRVDYFSLERLHQASRIFPIITGYIGAATTLLGLLVVAYHRFRILLLLSVPMVGYYFFTIVPSVGPDSNNERVFLGLLPLLSIFSGFFLDTLWNSPRCKTFAKCCCITLVFGVIANGFMMTGSLINDTRYQTEKWILSNTHPGANIDIVGYKRTGPRSLGQRTISYINHWDAPSLSNFQITSDGNVAKLISNRNPSAIVVAESYVARLRTGGRWTSKDFFCNGHQFVSDLESGKLGYRKAVTLKPIFGNFFGMPEYRDHIPVLTIYKRIVDERK